MRTEKGEGEDEEENTSKDDNCKKSTYFGMMHDCPMEI